ncbi:MAG TPA: hypothetical protein VFU06_00050 [Longimicrobiales bacterium]|nr:hypothetical protein [Longimicrobiales bacterium]
MRAYEAYLREQVNGRGVREKDCPLCGGDGFVEHDDGPRMFAIHTCTYCAGRKRVPNYDCDACEDTGIVERGRTRLNPRGFNEDVPALDYCDGCSMGEYAESKNVLRPEPWGEAKGPEWLEEMRAVARGEAL